ncbi:MAG: LysR family transcriptional regulator [Rhodovibrio sp.]|nr:LysR family transcriptional regulator [Rhodovibrio sp.]
MSSDGPSFKALHAFEATIRLGSMTAAAREIGTSQPAVSQRIRHLEDVLGTPLIVRGVKRAVPSPAGRAYYDEIAGPLHRIQAATRTHMAEAAGYGRRVVIAAHFGFAHLWLLPRLDALEARFPETRFEVMPVDGDTRSGRPSEPGHRTILAIRFGSVRLGRPARVSAADRARLSGGAPAVAERHGVLDLAGKLDEAAVSEVPLLHMDTGDPRWLDWPRWCELAGLPAPPPGRFFYRNYPLLMRAVADGAGVALVWERPRRGPGHAPVSALAPAVERPDWGYILSAANYRSAALSPIVAWLRRACQATGQLAAGSD